MTHTHSLKPLPKTMDSFLFLWIHGIPKNQHPHLQSEDVLRFIQLYLLQVEHVSGRSAPHQFPLGWTLGVDSGWTDQSTYGDLSYGLRGKKSGNLRIVQGLTMFC